MTNSIFTLEPYKTKTGQWVFDDPAVGLVKEAFVCGADALLDDLTEDIKDAENGVTLLFSENAFPGSMCITRTHEESNGNWYVTDYGHELWLCPALYKYFPKAPEKIYLKVISA